MNPGRWFLLAAVAAAAIATGVILFNDDGHGDATAIETSPQNAAAKTATTDADGTDVPATPDAAGANASREAVATETTPGADAGKAGAEKDDSARTISGRVVDDAGRPVTDADVEMISFGLATSDVKGAPAPGRTDAGGNFSFTQRGDASAVDRVRVRSKQFADGFAQVPQVPGKVDVGTIVVEAGGSIMGRVLDTSGNPVAKAKVTAYVKDKARGSTSGMFVFGDLDPARARTATSDPSGAWRIDGLPAGEISLSADADGYAPETMKGVEVEKLKVTPDLVMNLGKGATIEGLVLDASGRPLAGAAVTVTRQVIDLSEAGVGASFGRNVVHNTDANGRFKIEGLRDEPYSVGVRADGYLRKNVEGVAAGTSDVRVQLKPSGVLFGVVTDASSKKPLADFDVSLDDDGFGFVRFERVKKSVVLRGAAAAQAAGVPEEPGLFAIADLADESVTLNVKADGFSSSIQAGVQAASGQKTRVDVALTPEITVSGIVRAPDGTPVEGALVTLTNVGADQDNFIGGPTGGFRKARRAVRIEDDGSGPKMISDATPKTATTDADGAFKIGGLAAGDHSIQARHSRFARSESKPVNLESGDQLEGIELKLRAGGSLVGTAFDQYGKPLAGANVSLSTPDTSQTIDGQLARQEFGGFGEEAASATSDDAGKYALAGILPGEYVLRVSRPASMSGNVFVAISGMNDGPTGTPVSIREGEETSQDVSLPPTGDVIGSVTEAGRPIKSARVTLSTGGGLPFGEPSGVTDEDGKFAIRDVKPGGYSLVVNAPKSAVPFKSKVRVDPKRETTEHVKLPSGAIRGRVVEEDTNKGLAGIVIDVRKADFDEEEGGGEQREVRMIAFASADGGGGATTMKFGNEADNVVTDDDGNYEVRFLAPGTYKVSIRGGGIIKMDKEPVVVPATGAADGVDFRAAVGATLSVVADFGQNADDEDESGFRLVEVTVGPVDNPGERDTQAEIGSGACTFPGLKPGRYSVEVKAGSKRGEQVVDIESGEQKKLSVPVR